MTLQVAGQTSGPLSKLQTHARATLPRKVQARFLLLSSNSNSILSCSD